MTHPIPRGIDHVVFAVRDLDASCALFNRLGFTTTPRGAHRGPSGNSLIQLQGNYIELVSASRPAKPVPANKNPFSFGGFNAEVLQHREGMTMLAFASDDARRDLAEFSAAGLTTHGPLDFKSTAPLPGI
jgi:catechol 2,3-dioxygenase-like lactoylglutathione lyase family enzyme